MSSNEGIIGEDGFYNSSAPVGEMPVPLARHPHQTQGPPGGGAIPSHIMWPPPQILNQQYIHHQQHAPPPPPQQQQQYNELYYNMHAQAYATPPVQPETYSVLPVGHGNFLKVYHSAEGGPGVSGANESIIYQQQFQQQQHQQQFHLPTPPQSQPPIFNSYELFSSNSLMPTPENSNIASAPPANVSAHELSMPPPPLHLMSNTTELHSTASTATSNTNMIINKLVNNWSPNLTGSTYAQLSAPLGQMPSNASVPIQSNAQNCSQLDVQFSAQIQSVQAQLPATINPIPHNNQDVPNLTFNNMSQIVTTTTPMQPGFLPQTTTLQTPVSCAPTQQQHSLSQQQPVAYDGSDGLSPTAEVRSTLNEASSASTTALQSQTALTTPLQLSEGSKKRIVAEVKPMRMTYSDVLSKFNNQHSSQTAQSQSTSVKVNSNRSAKQNTSNAGNTHLFNERKTDHKRVAEANINPSSFMQRQSSIEESISPHTKPVKKSPTHDNKENVMQGNAVPNNSKPANNKQRLSGSATNNPINNKNSQKANQKTVLNDVVYTAAAATIGASQKKRAKKGAETDFNSDSSTARFTTTNKTNSSTASEKDFNGFYNVAAKNTDNTTKSTQNLSSFNSFRRSAKSTGPTYSTSSTQSYSRNAQRTSNGSASSSSYSYSTKRGRSANTSTANNNHNTRNRNYEMAKKFMYTWFEYTLKILTWLFYLVNDIVVLGFSMVYERLSYYYACGFAYAQQLRKDLKQNSNKPSIFIRNYLRRFDARFKKNSKWAFWRRFYKKKQPEASADFYKNGRLPQTGEEAMYSLLNCKGKDAYSILGVPPNSSQEQIRKHYKKIAVLVHPDKNKQAGAEEAFKVLQRAFELIGEPENREAYDRGLDEALHAEKAWTELHDLLSQLQTKITEAANTIRCSTCGLRHPRKLTDRPHYAARECASCKIRHSAREGDIWAETTLFGLRWKYLALMEGKVYDITEWANCQKGALSHLEPNSHMVQYRIVRGAQQQQQQQQQQHMHHQHQQQPNTSNHQQFPHTQGSNKYKRDIPPSEASLHEFLDNLYSGQHPGGQPNSTAFSGTTRKRTRRN